jgi:polar amino acid transport system permease protein
MQVVLNNWTLLLPGLFNTIQLSIQVILFGTVVGLVGGTLLLFGHPLIRATVRAYVDIVRGTPLLVSIFLIFYGIPALGIPMPAFSAAVIALTVFAGAHMSEIVRGAVGSVPRGQTEAAMAIGLPFAARLRFIVFPQAVRRMIPPWVNLCVELIKGSTLVSLVSVTDLMLSTREVLERTAQPVPFFVLLAIVYFVMCYGFSRFGGQLERRFAYYD